MLGGAAAAARRDGGKCGGDTQLTGLRRRKRSEFRAASGSWNLDRCCCLLLLPAVCVRARAIVTARAPTTRLRVVHQRREPGALICQHPGHDRLLHEAVFSQLVVHAVELHAAVLGGAREQPGWVGKSTHMHGGSDCESLRVLTVGAHGMLQACAAHTCVPQFARAAHSKALPLLALNSIFGFSHTSDVSPRRLLATAS